MSQKQPGGQRAGACEQEERQRADWSWADRRRWAGNGPGIIGKTLAFTLNKIGGGGRQRLVQGSVENLP